MNYWTRRKYGRGERKVVFYSMAAKESRQLKRAGRLRHRNHMAKKRQYRLLLSSIESRRYRVHMLSDSTTNTYVERNCCSCKRCRSTFVRQMLWDERVK